MLDGGGWQVASDGRRTADSGGMYRGGCLRLLAAATMLSHQSGRRRRSAGPADSGGIERAVAGRSLSVAPAPPSRAR